MGGLSLACFAHRCVAFSAQLWWNQLLRERRRALLEVEAATSPQAEERQQVLLSLCVQLLRAKCKMHPSGVMLLLDNVQWMDEVDRHLPPPPLYLRPGRCGLHGQAM